MEFESNWANAMGGHTDYAEHIEPKSGPDGPEGPGGGGKTPEYTAPKDYKPSTVDQRSKWNSFLDFLDKKGVGGSKDLDARDKSLGLKYLKEYNETHPDQAVSEDFIPTAQYESYLIRRKGEFPGMSSDQAKYAFSGLSPAYKSREISAVDNWLGSSTSKQYYPTFERHTSSGTTNFGTSFEGYVKGLNFQPAQ